MNPRAEIRYLISSASGEKDGAWLCPQSLGGIYRIEFLGRTGLLGGLGKTMSQEKALVEVS